MRLRVVLLMSAAAVSLAAQSPSEKAWRILTEGVQDRGVEKRAKAVRALGLLAGDAEALRLLHGAMLDQRPEVRAAAADALGQVRDKASVAYLESALDDKDTSVVLAAANSLLLMGDRAAYEVYYAVLTGAKKGGEGLVQSELKTLRDPKQLARMGFEQGIGFVPFAGIGWEAFKEITKDDSSPVRAAAAEKLAQDPDPKSGEALVQAAADKKWLVRAAVADAIAKRSDRALVGAAVSLLSDDNDTVRFNAAAAVIRLSRTASSR